MVQALLARLGNADTGPIDGPGLSALLEHSWPGNVRELSNALSRALTLAGGPRPFSQLSFALESAPAPPLSPGASFQEQKQAVVDTFERQFLEDLLRKAGGSIKQASRLRFVELTDVDPPDIRTAVDVKEEVAAIGQELRKYVLTFFRQLNVHYFSTFTTAVRDFVN